MKLGKILSFAAAFAITASGLQAMDYAKVYEKECQGCHGPIHQGGVGADIRPKALSKKNDAMLVNTILEGRQGTSMPAWKSKFSKADAEGMVKWLKNWKNTLHLKLTFDNVHKSWKKLADVDALAKKYPVDKNGNLKYKGAQVKNVKDITFATERDASLVDFIDSTTGKILSRHKAGFAVHVTVTNKHNPRYAYSISRSGRLTMFDIGSPGQPAVATVQVGQESRGLGVSPDGKYVLAGDYTPGGAVLCDAHTLEPLKVYPTDNVDLIGGGKGESRVAGIADTPYGPYFAMALKDAGSVFIIDYSKKGFPIVGKAKNIGKILHDCFENENKGPDYGRYFQVASQQSDLMGIVDFKTKKLVAKVMTGDKTKPHPGQGSSWYNKRLGKQLNATNDIRKGLIVIWDSPGWNVIKKVKTAGGGLFVGTSEHTPYLWADCVLGGEKNYNKVYLINKETLTTDRIIEVDKYKGKLIDAKSGKVLQTWDATQYKTIPGKEEKSKMSNEIIVTYGNKGEKVANPVQPRLLHAEPANHGKWVMISEWTTGRIGIYDAKTGKFIKYIYNLTTPTFTYSVEHRQHVPGA